MPLITSSVVQQIHNKSSRSIELVMTCIRLLVGPTAPVIIGN